MQFYCVIFSLLTIIIFVSYIVRILRKFKTIPSSLSDTYYMLGGQNGNGNDFTWMMLLLTFSILMPIMSITPEKYLALSFLCPAAIGAVGTAPCFRDKSDETVHFTMAAISAFCGILWVILVTDFWYIVPASVVLMLGLAWITKTITRCMTWWLEMVAFNSVLLSLFIQVCLL